jgi:transcriptional regulator with XRE-family HTH domain
MTVKGTVLPAKSKKLGNAEFGKWLAAKREEAGMSRYDLAEALSISYPYVSQLETGYRTPSTSVIGAIRTALGVDVGEIYAILYPPAMVREEATMAMLHHLFTKHPRLLSPLDKERATVESIEVDGTLMALTLSDSTVITLVVDRREIEDV